MTDAWVCERAAFPGTEAGMTTGEFPGTKGRGEGAEMCTRLDVTGQGLLTISCRGSVRGTVGEVRGVFPTRFLHFGYTFPTIWLHTCRRADI